METSICHLIYEVCTRRIVYHKTIVIESTRHITINIKTRIKLIGYEPADLTVHPHPLRTGESGFIFLYRCLVFPKKSPQRKA